MNKNISILIAMITVLTACNNGVKQHTEKITSNNKTGPILPVKNGDSLFHAYARPGAKKLSCCASLPSRGKIKVYKKQMSNK